MTRPRVRITCEHCGMSVLRVNRQRHETSRACLTVRLSQPLPWYVDKPAASARIVVNGVEWAWRNREWVAA
jgi:hypothetical protein